jgi:hypothetical protein
MTLTDPVTWQRFEDDAPELAALGRERLQAGASHLATTRADGCPGVHLINPKVHGGHLTVGLRKAAGEVFPQGHWSKTAALAMAFRLIESAQRLWRLTDASHLVALVSASATFVNGRLAERPDDPRPADLAAEVA